MNESNNNNDDDDDDDDDDGNNNNNHPVALKSQDNIRQGIVKSYEQMKRCLALVDNPLEMVPR